MPKFIVVEVSTTETFSSYEEAVEEAASCYRDSEEVVIYEVISKFTPTKVVFQREDL